MKISQRTFVIDLDMVHSPQVLPYRSSTFDCGNEAELLCVGKITTVTNRRTVADRYPAWTIPGEENMPFNVIG